MLFICPMLLFINRLCNNDWNFQHFFIFFSKPIKFLFFLWRVAEWENSINKSIKIDSRCINRYKHFSQIVCMLDWTGQEWWCRIIWERPLSSGSVIQHRRLSITSDITAPLNSAVINALSNHCVTCLHVTITVIASVLFLVCTGCCNYGAGSLTRMLLGLSSVWALFYTHEQST